jgi:predicted Zn-dependent protease
VEQPQSVESERAQLVHREIQQLIALIVVAVLAFFLTRTFAAQTRAIRRHDAAEWSDRGDAALRAGRVPEAVELYRRAVVRDPVSVPYRLALALALDADRQGAAAAEALLALREVDPENPDVNMALARVSARLGDSQAAVRYYQSALNALWRPDDRGRRRVLRLELIRFLIDAGQPMRAVPEVMTLSTNLPEDAAWKTRVGLLLLEVNEPRRAVEVFTAALALDPSDADARAGLSRARALIDVSAPAGK